MKKIKKALPIILSILLVIGAMPLSAFAVTLPASFTTVVDREMQLAPGITQNNVVVYDQLGRRQEFYVATADMNVSTVHMEANYPGHQLQHIGIQELENQVAAAEADNPEPYTVVSAINGSFFDMTKGYNNGLLIMNGVNGADTGVSWNVYPGRAKGFFGVTYDGTPVIDYYSEYASTYSGNLYNAVAGGTMLVYNGEVNVEESDWIEPRSCVGITADNKVITIAFDGRNPSEHCGMDYYTEAMILKSMGCVRAIELDGGGSTGYYARYPGEETGRIQNKPSDGKSRKIASSLMMISTAVSDGVFDHAWLETGYDYMTPGTSIEVMAKGLDHSGAPTDLPSSGLAWSVSDPSKASITQDGVVTAADGASGAFTINLSYNGSIVGSRQIEIVIPDDMSFTKTQITMTYGSTVKLPFEATYMLEPVAMNNEDFIAIHEYEFDFKVTEDKWDLYGTFDGLYFTAPQENIGIRNERLYAISAYAESEDDIRTIDIEYYKEGEDFFDYDLATGGTKGLAWIRDVGGATLISRDETDTYFKDSGETDTTVDYTFALEVSNATVPEDLVPMWESFSELLGGNVWSAFLSVASKIDSSSYFMAEIQVDPNFVVINPENITISGNEMFYIDRNSITYDTESNLLSIKCMWNKAYVDSLASSGSLSPENVRSSVIVNGLKLKLRDDAVFDAENMADISNVFTLKYKFVIFSIAAYNTAREKGMYDYAVIIYNPAKDADDYAIQFAATYITTDDSFILQNSARSGLTVDASGDYYYYNNNDMLKGGNFALTEMNGLAEPGNYDIMADGKVVLSTADGGMKSCRDLEALTGSKYLLEGIDGATGSVTGVLSGGVLTSYTAVKFGDINGDGKIDGCDSVLVNCIVQGMTVPGGAAAVSAADCDHSGTVEDADASLLASAGVFTATIDQNYSL
ncbi:MAG: phosphodiester glycosidase family protein [Clostridia bacterium]|nr:phosphodiester glycosidase family protein [Clostridia bacterium]